jgi:very-short-patch-repair endonuclease
MHWKDELKFRGLVTTGFHLPYNPKLISRAKELRKNMTDAEKKLWKEYLRFYTYRVLRQRPIDHYIVDFYCAKLKLVIEVDGEIHNDKIQKEYDDQRTLFLNAYGLTVIRFRNEEVMNEFEKVCEKIESFL